MGKPDTPKRTSSGKRAKGPLVLLVEDAVDVRALFTEILMADGFRVIDAHHGHAAVVKALAYLPDVIVMDISLPLMDGARAARVLRSNDRSRPIPIVAFTARTLDPRDRREFDAVLHKPCAPEALIRTVRLLLAERQRGSRGS
jgi:two-component system cell cycle response regulator DivK